MKAHEAATAQREAKRWSQTERYWTRDRVLGAMQAYADRTTGPLPCGYTAWWPIKNGDLELPTAAAITREFGSLPHLWLAAGAPRRRVCRKFNVRWRQWEDDFLREHVGDMSYAEIAFRLWRSTRSVISRRGHLGLDALSNQGWLTANEVARYFHCPVTRVHRLIAAKTLMAHRRGRYWAIDLIDALAIEDVLRAPKQSYLGSPPNMGDYYQRYGLRRAPGGGSRES